METVQNLKLEVNKLLAQIATAEAVETEKNTPLFFEEVLNFLDGVGENYISGDYYAPARYYSDIKGVKNIRLGGEIIDGVITLDVKITSPTGHLIPDEFMLNNKNFRVNIIYSDKYETALDY